MPNNANSNRNIQLYEIHKKAKKAASIIIKEAGKAGHGLGEYFERQLEHEVGYLLKKRSTFLYFNYVYPHGGRTDILVEQYPDIGGERSSTWIEIKFKKSGLSNLGWKADFRKLRKVRQGSWQSHHAGYWIWLYIFDNYETEIVKRFGNSNTWQRIRSVKQIAAFFIHHNNHRKLGNVLTEICKACGNVGLCSILPSLPLREYSSYSALLITTQVKR